ncbi:MAG: DNA recombination protein RmuC [Bacteroidales bacterium]|nr:DNA recombination protein RmuC [Candidatus Colicola caccequi]
MELIIAFISGLVLAAIGAYFMLRSEREREKERESERERERELMNQRQLELLSAQFETTSQRLLQERSEALSKTNSETVGKLLDPLKQEMENVRKLMGDTRSANETSTASLKGALEQMIRQTTQISQDATNLADALKNRGKVHGDWGEQVLEDILAGSGLRKNEEYLTQQSYKGANGNELRPDVVINCADNHCIIVDSKVSLTAYTNALGADTEVEREEAIKENCRSVKAHVDELVKKEYPKYVPGAMNYVLMFIPNEGAYVMAMNHDRALAQEAYRKGVVIVNPTNLMLTLHLILQSWQQTRQEDNCKAIIEAANNMYDKVVGLVDTCNTLGGQLDTVNRTYQKAITQLSEGNGNLLRRVEGLRELGVTSTKRATKRISQLAKLEITN